MSTKPRRTARTASGQLLRGALYVAAGCAVVALVLYVLPPHTLVGSVVAVVIGLLSVIVAFGPLGRPRLTMLPVAAYALTAMVMPLAVSWLAIGAFGAEVSCQVTEVDERVERDERTGDTTYTYVHTVVCPDGDTLEVEKSREWAAPGTTAEVLRDSSGLLRSDFAEGRTPWGVLLLVGAAVLLDAVAVVVVRAVLRDSRS